MTQLDFFNTISLTGDQLKECRQNTMTQNERVLNIFKEYQKPFTPFQVHDIYRQIYHTNTPITSIRRAITSLTCEGKLTKTPNMKIEEYGKPNYYWIINQ